MVNLDTAYSTLYKQALVDPSQLAEDDLLNLIVRYPYSQPLLFAYERRKKLVGEDSPNKELALLYAPNSNWLWNYVHKPVEIIEELIPEQEDYIPFVELVTEDTASQDIVLEQESIDLQDVLADEAVSNEEVSLPHDNVVDTVCSTDEQDDQTVSSSDDSLHTEEDIATNLPIEEFTEEKVKPEATRDELDTLVQAGGITGDYFLFDKKNKEADQIAEPTVEESAALVAAERKKEKENISLYNDDLMPYSFRWWLHKTRLEYADTYQPFAKAFAPYKDSAPAFLNNLEKTILDQQIKENIIHLQDPETKLSEAVKQRPIESVQPKKSDPIIERFIKEEPIIQPPAPDNLNNENMARQSAEDNYVLVTETLAKIYEDQGLYLKAIEVFKKLILKYPEKKSYFANRIQELEKNL